MRTPLRIATLAAAVISLLALGACGGKGKNDASAADTVHPWPDTLRVATLYSPTSYFVYRDEPMGYDYTLVSDMARDRGFALDLQVVPTLSTAMDMLDSGLVDLVAYEVPVIAENNRRVQYCGPVIVTDQVLVQPRSGNPITDVTQLVGRDVYVERNSKYHHRIDNLNAELGGGINVRFPENDSVIAEDLLDRVAKGKLPLTVVDSHLARLNATYYPNLDVSMQLSFGQRAQWAVANNKAWLADSINKWFGDELPRREIDVITKRYFQLSKNIPSLQTYDLSKGRISAYDALFRRYARNLGWDWRLLAAQCYVESRFDPSVVSWAGAKGIMQVMPSTARANGFSPAEMTDPEKSVQVAVKILDALDRTFASRVSDPAERRLFVLAAYNSGGAHILDAIEIARRTGRNPAKWHGNVEDALLLKADPTYYNAPGVKYGYFRGRQTVEYVRQVEAFYARAQKHIKK